MDFDWDESKAEANLIKHGISFVEAATVFEDDFSITFPDAAHSISEQRFIVIGQSHRGHLLFVSHTDENDQTRIISAREVTRRERKVYKNVQR